MLREAYDGAPPKSSRKLHASLALLPVDAGQVDYLYGRLLEADARELEEFANPDSGEEVNQRPAVIRCPRQR